MSNPTTPESIVADAEPSRDGGKCSSCGQPAERLDGAGRGYVWCDTHSYSRDIPIQVATAAPELLSALVLAINETTDGLHQSPCDEPDCWVETARAAIAKAEGRGR